MENFPLLYPETPVKKGERIGGEGKEGGREIDPLRYFLTNQTLENMNDSVRTRINRLVIVVCTCFVTY